MGMYTTLFRERECSRCELPFLADYQFKTGNDFLEKFRDGDLVPDNFEKNVVYEATYSPMCHVCEGFMQEYTNHLKEKTMELLLQSDYEIRRTKNTSFIWKGKARVGEYVNGNLTSTLPVPPIFRPIERKVIEFWARQIKAAHAEQWIKIQKRTDKVYWKHPATEEYRVLLHADVISLAARVHLGKRFRIEEIDLGGKDARLHFLNVEMKETLSILKKPREVK